LPIVFYYTDEEGRGEMVPTPSGQQCVISALGNVRNGKSLYFGEDSIGCGGGKRYLGFTHEMRDGFEYFLSYGIKGQVEGERYKKTPEIVKKMWKYLSHIVRWYIKRTSRLPAGRKILLTIGRITLILL